MLRRFASVASAAVILAVGASPASAADLKLGAFCYPQGFAAHGLTSGLNGNALSFTLDGKPFSGKVIRSQADRTLFSFRTPFLSRGTEHRFRIGVSDGTTAVSRLFAVSTFTAEFHPTAGNPQRLRTRFSFSGFGAGKTIYMHYIAPGSRRSTLNRPLGRLGGVCGKLRTGLKRLYPFSPKLGTWKFQFDTSRRYSSRTLPRFTRRYKIFRVARF